MSTRTMVDPDRAAGVNEVRLVGRLTKAPVARELPSGDQLLTFRLAVDRPETSAVTRQKVDSVPCSVWAARTRRTVSTWRVGDVVEVRGEIRCRFFRAGAGLGSRVEIEVSGARIVRRSRGA